MRFTEVRQHGTCRGHVLHKRYRGKGIWERWATALEANDDSVAWPKSGYHSALVGNPDHGWSGG